MHAIGSLFFFNLSSVPMTSYVHLQTLLHNGAWFYSFIFLYTFFSFLPPFFSCILRSKNRLFILSRKLKNHALGRLFVFVTSCLVRLFYLRHNCLLILEFSPRQYTEQEKGLTHPLDLAAVLRSIPHQLTFFFFDLLRCSLPMKTLEEHTRLHKGFVQ